MYTDEIKYQKRIVAFLDVIGFQGKLAEFEDEAVEADNENGQLVSSKANAFVSIFKEVVGLMDKFNCNYYLFSDNICITVDPYDDKRLAIDLLFTISTLFKRFSDLGYFLRGGIDFGYMLDEKDIALGVPLANAYLMESKTAIYPRILVSEKFMDFLNSICIDGEAKFNKANFLKNSCELWYINPFYNIIKTDDKLNFFKEYRKSISSALKETMHTEHLYVKYQWLSNEYNTFLKKYISEINYFEQSEEVDQETIQRLQRLKIKK